MTYTHLIKKHIFELPEDKIFTTRDLLLYGKRNSIDQCLWKLVKSNVIQRVARGVFVRTVTQAVTVDAIARAKAKAFGKKIIDHPENLFKQVGARGDEFDPNKYQINGCSSSFISIFGRIYFYATAMRQFKIGNSRAGNIIRHIWHEVREGKEIRDAIRSVPLYLRKDMEDLRMNIRWMPHWLGDIHAVRPLPPSFFGKRAMA